MCTFQFISLTRHCFETSKLCVLLWVYQNIVTEMQMNLVNICPKTIKEIHKSSRKLNCSKDEYGNNQYLCLPNVEKTSLVEFCHTGTMGLQPDDLKCFKDKEQKSNVNDQESKYFKDKEQKPSMNDQETSEQPLKNYEQQATVIQHTEHIRHLYSKYSEAEVLLQEEVTHTLVTSCTDSATV
uniref:Uncharacterized protein LOC111105290 isoform X2 n=1 Tax=Crassostrea virginica TaxID=6565 RepID=A0A8B8AV72_CRAVI|nr:uncharacterized protein LOC111105290 isoform X2 [Crassostrea virginica]